MENSMIETQRAYIAKRYGEEFAATLKVKFEGEYYASSTLDGGRASIHSYRPHGRIRHEVRGGQPGREGEPWVYPEWMKMPKLPELPIPGTRIFVAGRSAHLGCQCEVLGSQVKIAGPRPKVFVKHQLRCLNESCRRRREFSYSDSLDGRARLIELPITIEKINGERNTEVRRVMIENYGADKYLRESNAVLISQDDWGKLWSLEQPQDEPLVMVEMVNSTPEPDGSYSTYFERVPPQMQRPLQALAWQADLSEIDYARMTVQT